ncbi:MAG: DUF354 domain-containing protein [Bacteroidota bacterium]|nr:DUF354 domain-containing protein [Bacteroidota bacterium]
MKILCLLSHPAQFYFFKNTITRLRELGDTVTVLIKTKDILEELLNETGWEYENILPVVRGKSRRAIIGSLLKRDDKVLQITRKTKADLLMGSDASLAHAAKLLGKPCLSFTEDDYAVIHYLADLTFPFTRHIITPEICDVGKWESKKIGYKGYMKLAYLHPDYFTPDRSKVNIPVNKPYYLIRLSGLNAHHDFGIKGISKEVLRKIIEMLSETGNVFINSEIRSSYCFPDLHIDFPPIDIHHYLNYAEMLVSDSQSMSMEAAMLGTPSIRISDFSGRISVLEELEKKYSLTYGVKPSDEQGIFDTVNKLLNMPDRKEIFQARRKKMLNDKIDVTAFLTWFIHDYPASAIVMKKLPEFQYKFGVRSSEFGVKMS